MKTGPDCLVCLVRQAVEAGRFLDLPETVRQALIRNTLAHLAQQNWEVSAPELAAEAQEYLRNLAHNDDPYLDVKRASTQAALRMYPEWKRLTQAANDRFLRTLRLSAAGNLIDCGPTGRLDLDEVTRRLYLALDEPFARQDFGLLQQQLTQARLLLLIADNAGELVADRLLLETIEELFPHLEIHLIVRGGPVLNDVTRVDAQESGCSPRWTVHDSHSRIPGLALHRCPESVQKTFYTADVIIAKGQGNWETLNETRHPGLFFLLTCKCPAVAHALQVKTGGAVLVFSQTQSHLESADHQDRRTSEDRLHA